MNNNAKKALNTAVIAMASIALLTLAAVVYAQGNDRNHENHHAGDNDMRDMMGGKGMDEMHKQMAKNLDSDTIEQMDKMHQQCGKLHEDKTVEDEMMQ